MGERAVDNQTFVVDGDSIIMAEDREKPAASTTVRVVQVANSRGANGAAIVAAPRNLADSELFTFTAIDGSGRIRAART